MSLEGKLIIQVTDDRTCLCILKMHGFAGGLSVPDPTREYGIVGSPIFQHNYNGIECHTVIFRFVGFEKECDNGYFGMAGACSDFTFDEFRMFVERGISSCFRGLKLQPIPVPAGGLN